jgi:hypothetical protein
VACLQQACLVLKHGLDCSCLLQLLRFWHVTNASGGCWVCWCRPSAAHPGAFQAIAHVATLQQHVCQVVHRHSCRPWLQCSHLAVSSHSRRHLLLLLGQATWATWVILEGLCRRRLLLHEVLEVLGVLASLQQP